MRRRYATVLRTQCHAAWASHALFWLPSMRGSVKGMARRCLRVRRRRSVSTSFVRLDAPRRHLGRAAGWQRLRGPWAVTLAWVAVASGVRVREVADPKCRCPGTGRPRWMTKTPRGALPGSRFLAAGVGCELPVDGIGQAPPQAAHRFHGGLPGGALAPVAVAACSVVAQLDDPGRSAVVAAETEGVAGRVQEQADIFLRLVSGDRGSEGDCLGDPRCRGLRPGWPPQAPDAYRAAGAGCLVRRCRLRSAPGRSPVDRPVTGRRVWVRIRGSAGLLAPAGCRFRRLAGPVCRRCWPRAFRLTRGRGRGRLRCRRWTGLRPSG
jgi:hypothetical protein